MQIFDFDDYRKYLQRWISQRPGKGRGEVSRLAKAAQCHVTYFSQVLHGKVDLSLEQAHRLNPVLGHTGVEAECFFLLVLGGRAGTKGLREHFEAKRAELKKAQLHLSGRIRGEEALSLADQAFYYSGWAPGAVHLATSVPGLQSKERISRALGLGLRRTGELLAFLVRVGLVEEKGGRYEYRTGQMHLRSDSPLVAKHHTNWRMRAIASLDADPGEDLHYSSVISVGEKDIPNLQAILIEAIEKARALVRESPEEAVVCYSVDAFRLDRLGRDSE